jgi:hypothetical protein
MKQREEEKRASGSTYDPLEYHAYPYDDYIAALADTTFVLCPAGNNPETFRHFEVSLRMCGRRQ